MMRNRLTWLFAAAFLVVILVTASCSHRPERKRLTIWDFDHMHQVRKSVRRGFSPYRDAYRNLMEEADKAMGRGPYSVTAKKIVPEGGSPNDYLSFNSYWWPDSLSMDGMPYIRNGNAANPEGSVNRLQLSAMVEDVRSLTMAWYFSREKSYAEKAAENLRSWFIDPATCMSPHLEYARAIPGRTGGRATGIIEAYPLISLVDAVVMAEASGALRKHEEKKIRQWFSDYLSWLTASVQSHELSGFYNRHALALDVQVACIAHFLGNDEFVLQKLHGSIFRRIEKMIGPDGRQTEELKYGTAYAHSVANLADFFTVAELGSRLHADTINFLLDGEGSIRSALEFLLTYAGNDNNWQWGREGDLTDDHDTLGLLVRRAGWVFKDPEYQIVWEQAYEKRLDTHWSLLVMPGFTDN